MMRRRFGRRRWGGGGGGDESGGGRPLDAAQELARVLQLGIVPADALEPAGGDEVPAKLAAVGTGTSRDGEALVVGVAPQGGDAWLAALAAATRIAGFRGAVLAIAPSWPLAARRRLGLLRPTPFRVEARREPVAGVAEGGVEAEPLEPALASGAAAGLAPTEPRARALFERSQLALAGLAAKHGGAARGAPDGTELVLLGRTVAVLRSDASNVSLELREGRRETARLAPDNVAETFDRLEGSLRKFLGDRRSREGDEAARFVLADALLAHLAPRASLRWPLVGDPGEALDFAAVDAEGAGIAGFARGTLGLLELGGILDAWAALVPALPALVPGVGSAAPALVVAAEQLLPPAQRVLARIDAEVRWLEASRRGREPAFAPRDLPSADAPAREPWSRPVEPAPAPLAPSEVRPVEPQPTPAPIAAPAAPAADAASDTGGRRPYEEFSLFDLGEGGGEEAAPGGDGRRRRRRRRGRGRGRGGAPPAAAREEDADGDADEEEEPRARSADERAERGDGRGESRGRGRDRGRRRDRPERPPQPTPIRDADAGEADADAEADDDALLDEAIGELAEIPEIEAPEPSYDEDEEGEEEGGPEDEEQRRMRQEREQRRLARLAKGDPEADAPPPPRPPRRRAAILAHADRESVAAAVLLARDIRLIEGIWIYPQEDLMTFFRNVATDLREDTPIVVVGFTARPLRETLQTASLYRDRLVWYDHHEWPPEDVGAMKSAIAADNVHVDAAAGSALAVVLSVCTRRSRFSDKLIDLLTGRFTAHDYARWGRLWWSRLAQLAARHGERRTELEGLLVGRPSDLAKQAARVAAPPVPEEVGWVAARDFRIVHFGGHALVRVPVPPQLDLHLAARIARERYRASLSLAWSEGSDRFVLCGDEAVAQRPLDVGAMIEHLDAKFAWVTALPDPDHVARMRIADAGVHPERIDEVVTEIAMGRSLLEG